MKKEDIKIGTELFIVTAGNNVIRSKPKGFSAIVSKVGRKYFDIEYMGVYKHTITFQFDKNPRYNYFPEKTDYTLGYHAYESKDAYMQQMYLTNLNSYVKYKWSGAESYDQAKQIADVIGANIEIDVQIGEYL